MLGNIKLKKYFSFAVAVALLSSYFSSLQVGSFDIAETERSKLELQRRKKELGKELKSVATEVHKEADKKASLDSQIKVVKDQIDTSNQYITALEKEVEELEHQIVQIREDMKEKIEVLKKSLASIYIAGDTSTIDIILGSKDFGDFLDKVDIVRSVSQTMKKLIDDLQADIENIEKKEKDILESKKEKEKEKEILDKNRESLQNLLDQSEKLLAELQESEKKVKKQIDQSDAEIKAIDDKIQKYYEELKRKEEEARRKAAAGQAVEPADKVTPHKGGYVWPVPGFYKITSGFYDTESRRQAHGAIDIAGAGVYGANIVAAGAGRVILVNTDGYGGGYGNYVVIDHGNGISTLYAHMSVVSVKVGQIVAAGQKIGNVGNTGHSTGPHLHFEYRVNGVRRNPSQILSY